MSEETQDKICEGYLITGEQKNVDGGFTVDFQKRSKYYFVLWKRGEHLYNLEGYADERAFTGKRKSSVSLFGGRKKSLGSSSIPSYILTSGVKVHCMDMTIGRKKNHVIILVHARIPYYFKTLKEQEIKPWYKAFSSVASDMETRNADKNTTDEVIFRKSPITKHANHTSNDSGRGSNSSSVRSSLDSAGSRLSDIINSCPPSPSFIPTNIRVEMDGTENNEEEDNGDHMTPLSSAQKARRQLTNSVIYMKRERSDSTGESTGRYDFTEASGRTYDSVIRTSIVIDDVDEDAPKPELPKKSRPRRGSEPNLQIPEKFHHHRNQRISPTLQRASSQDQDGSPPPLPARPPSHYYENLHRKQSVPAGVNYMEKITSSLVLDHLYEKTRDVATDIGKLMWEQSKIIDGIPIVFSKAELLDSLVLVTINDEVWVASFKKDLNSQLYGKLHVGDKLRQINTQVVTSADLALEFIRTTACDEIQVTLSRLPYANLLNLSRSDPNIQWGICTGKSNTEIKSLTGGPAVTEGLTPKARGIFSGKTCDWVITEINHQRVPLVRSGKNQDLVKAELEADYKELPVVVQPHDFIKKLADAVKEKRGSQFY